MTSSESAQAVATRTARFSPALFLSLVQDVALVAIFGVFAYAQLNAVVDGIYRNIPFAIEYTLLFGLFLTRRRSRATSTRPLDWLTAAIASWLPFALQVSGGVNSALGLGGAALQMIGLSLSIVAFGFLGRSMGLVAADRGLKTNGAYSVVRHPAYAAQVLTLTGFLLGNPEWINVGIWSLVIIAMGGRIHAEERLLLQTSDYADYQARVRWRLVPGVF